MWYVHCYEKYTRHTLSWFAARPNVRLVVSWCMARLAHTSHRVCRVERKSSDADLSHRVYTARLR